MEVASTNRTGNRLPQSILKSLTASASQPDSTFEMLLDLPAVSASYIEPTAEGDASEEVATTQATESTESKPKSNEDDKVDSSEEKNHDAEETSASLAAACLSGPMQKCDSPEAKVESDATLEAGSKQSDEPLVAQTVTPTTEEAQPVDDSTLKFELRQGKELAVDKSSQATSTGKQQVDPLQPEASTETVPKVERVRNKNGVDQLSNQQPNSLAQAKDVQSKKEIKGRDEQTHQPFANPNQSVDTQSQPVEQSDRNGSDRDRPARWYERDGKQIGGEQSAKADQLEASSEAVAIAAFEKNESASQGTVDPAQALDANMADTVAAMDISMVTSTAALGSQVAATAVTASLAVNAGAEATSGTSTTSTAGTGTNANVRSLDSMLQKVNGANASASASNADPTQPNQPVDISRAEKARLVQRVARSFSRVGPMGGNVNLKLHPPELGALAVQVKIEGKSMTAKLTTESQAARDVIMESLPQLRSRLAEQGYDVQQFTVDVATDSSSLGNQTGQGGAGQGSSAWLGGQSGGSSDSSSRSAPPIDLRRSSYLRRQLDSVANSSRPTVSYGGRGIDVTA